MDRDYESPDAAKQALEDQSVIDHLVQSFPIEQAAKPTIEPERQPVPPTEFCEQIRRTEPHSHDQRTMLRGD
jgi:hypothetical protein